MALVGHEVPLRLVGKRLKRADSPERLTGQLRYTGDLVLPGLPHARLVRSPYASARIISVDRSTAERTPGVVAVLTAADLPVANIQQAVENRGIIVALERIVHVGQPVVVVLGDTEAAAQDGADAVEIEYDVQSATVDPLHALQPDSPVVRGRGDIDEEELGAHGAAAGGSQAEAPQAPNVATHQRYSRGDVEQAFPEADVVVGASHPAPSAIFRVKAGVKSDGTFLALKGDVIFDAGAKAGAPAAHAAMCLAVMYNWQNLDIETTEVVTHKTPNGAYRAPGLPQATFACESLVDELADKLGMDPIELRQKNVIHEGDIRPDGTPWPQVGLAECLARATLVYQQERASAGPSEGVGVAMGGWFGGIEPSSALCRLEPDGSLQVTLGAVDLTGTNNGFQIIAAEAFGLESADNVRVTTVDTDSAPFAGATGGSKTMYTMGPSVVKAAQEARERVLKIAAAELEAAVEDLELVDGEVRVKGAPTTVRMLREIYKLSASFGAKHEPVVGKGESAIVERSPGTGVHIARVRVERETGRIEPLRYIIVQDVGRAINPATVEAQIHGGGAQGVGWGMYEGIVHDEAGTPITASLMDYTIPKASQLPELEAILVEVPSTIRPYGAKPVGEPPVIPGGAAIANAVHAASGARITDLPLTSERVHKALQASQPYS